MHEGPFSATLVNTSLELHGLVENLGALPEDPQLVLLLSEVRIQILALLANRGDLASSRPRLNLAELLTERVSRSKELLIHGLISNFALTN